MTNSAYDVRSQHGKGEGRPADERWLGSRSGGESIDAANDVGATQAHRERSVRQAQGDCKHGRPLCKPAKSCNIQLYFAWFTTSVHDVASVRFKARRWTSLRGCSWRVVTSRLASWFDRSAASFASVSPNSRFCRRSARRFSSPRPVKVGQFTRKVFLILTLIYFFLLLLDRFSTRSRKRRRETCKRRSKGAHQWNCTDHQDDIQVVLIRCCAQTLCCEVTWWLLWLLLLCFKVSVRVTIKWFQRCWKTIWRNCLSCAVSHQVRMMLARGRSVIFARFDVLLFFRHPTQTHVGSSNVWRSGDLQALLRFDLHLRVQVRRWTRTGATTSPKPRHKHITHWRCSSFALLLLQDSPRQRRCHSHIQSQPGEQHVQIPGHHRAHEQRA